MNFVLDASLALSWCFEDEGGDYAVAVLEALRTSEAVAASLFPLEVVNGLLTAEHRGRLGAVDVRRAATLLLALPIVVDPVARRRTFEATHALARKHGLTSYDCSLPRIGRKVGCPAGHARLAAQCRCEERRRVVLQPRPLNGKTGQ